MYDGLYGWQVEGGFERGGRLVKDHWSNPTPQKRLKIPSYGLIFAKFVTFLKTHGGEKNELHTANNFLGDGCHKKVRALVHFDFHCRGCSTRLAWVGTRV